ncbi:transcription repressor NadR [Caryophanon tenue]|uniref:Transcriptional regulator n=1 Tax=Caryophanon tenue TaxID=33978 RepID=A0A1C0YMQ9_9BACL|nr:transcription repressor NadR [Caryophanon tenue]OCS88456.1 transcriptional regulator [Caryophanon tenue]
MKKILGEQRRNLLLNHLKQATAPITGTDLAKLANVSRQVIVNDITLLKARHEPILSTSQGYVYLAQSAETPQFERTIACLHTQADTEDEMFTIVDFGVTIKSVTVEHPVYGEITARMHVSNRHEVRDFIEKVTASNASYLSSLTGGTHLHVLCAPSEQALDQAIEALRQKGYLIEDSL